MATIFNTQDDLILFSSDSDDEIYNTNNPQKSNNNKKNSQQSNTNNNNYIENSANLDATTQPSYYLENNSKILYKASSSQNQPQSQNSIHQSDCDKQQQNAKSIHEKNINLQTKQREADIIKNDQQMMEQLKQAELNSIYSRLRQQRNMTKKLTHKQQKELLKQQQDEFKKKQALQNSRTIQEKSGELLQQFNSYQTSKKNSNFQTVNKINLEDNDSINAESDSSGEEIDESEIKDVILSNQSSSQNNNNNNNKTDNTDEMIEEEIQQYGKEIFQQNSQIIFDLVTQSDRHLDLQCDQKSSNNFKEYLDFQSSRNQQQKLSKNSTLQNKQFSNNFSIPPTSDKNIEIKKNKIAEQINQKTENIEQQIYEVEEEQKQNNQNIDEENLQNLKSFNGKTKPDSENQLQNQKEQIQNSINSGNKQDKNEVFPNKSLIQNNSESDDGQEENVEDDADINEEGTVSQIQNYKQQKIKNLPTQANLTPQVSNNLQTKQQQNAQIYQPPKKLESLQGYLYKISPIGLVGLQKRYITLENKIFTYYKSKKSKKQLGSLNFNQVSCEVLFYKGEKETEKFLKIEIKNSNKYFIFKQFEKGEPIEKWYHILQQHISQSSGNYNNLTCLLGTKRFWREKRISNCDFINNTKTGDLLLFRGRGFVPKTQRFFTGAEYDHVALILKKYGTNDIVLLESTGNNGVGMISWKGFTKYRFQRLYDKLVVRHLDYSRSDNFLDTLNSFIQFAVKKKYSFGLSHLVSKKAKKNEESLDNTKRTFFCSELIASAYKHLGLLPEHISSSFYWPGSFASCKELPLQDGAKLSEEFLIDFSIQPDMLEQPPSPVRKRMQLEEAKNKKKKQKKKKNAENKYIVK